MRRLTHDLIHRRIRWAGVAIPAALIAGLAACGGGSGGAAGDGHTRTQVVASSQPSPSFPATHSMAGMGDMSGMDMSGDTATGGSDLHGFTLNVPLPRPQFVLTDTSGKSYDFSTRTAGKVTLLYFGYTNCPYQCPTTMADIGIALRKLPASIRSKVTVVFVTTDPAHDTPAVLRKWLNQFNSRFIGLTGSQADLVAAQDAAHVTVSAPKPNEPAPQAGSTAHGGGALAYGTDDYAHISYPAGTTPNDLVKDLRDLVTHPQQH